MYIVGLGLNFFHVESYIAIPLIHTSQTSPSHPLQLGLDLTHFKMLFYLKKLNRSS